MGRGRRGRHLAVQLRRLRQLPALRAGAPGLRRRRSGHPQHRPGSRRGGGGRRDHGDPPGPHLRPAGAHGAHRRARRAARPRRPGGRLRGAARADRRRAGGRGAREHGRLRLLRQQADDNRRGRDDHPHHRRGGGAPSKLAKPGPGRRHGLARPRSAGLQLPAHRDPGRAGRRAARATRRAARGPRARRRPVRGASAAPWTAPRPPARATPRACCCPLPRGETSAAPGSSTPSGCRRAPTATR